jgi:hypothetical protein
MESDTTELNGNGACPRVRARDALQGIGQAGSAAASPSSGISPREREAEQYAAHAASFDAIVAPLEVGREPLNGRGRQACLAAFDESPEGFERIAGQPAECVAECVAIPSP